VQSGTAAAAIFKTPEEPTMIRCRPGSSSARLRVFALVGLLTLPAWAAADTDVAPDLNLPGRSRPVNLAALRGKVVYVDFWASWCGPCRKSFPWMNSMLRRYGDQGLVIVAVDLDKSRDLSDQFLRDVPADFLVAYDPDGKVAAAYHVKGMPSSYLIDRHGYIHSSHIGFRDDAIASVESTIETLLRRP
jgi:thiol-disulfide isomerase/thioredoxin